MNNKESGPVEAHYEPIPLDIVIQTNQPTHGKT